MPGVTKEQIERAKEWDLLSYLQTYEPQELGRCGKEHCTVSHDSLKISNGKWHWHSRGIGGRTALDYLVRVRGMDFVPAVEMLCGECGAVVPGPLAAKPGQMPPKPFRLPEANRYGTAMVSYLQGKGIDADIISQCIGLGIFYESRRYHNCVFVEADFLVNLYEQDSPAQSIEVKYNTIFKTRSGRSICKKMFGFGGDDILNKDIATITKQHQTAVNLSQIYRCFIPENR